MTHIEVFKYEAFYEKLRQKYFDDHCQEFNLSQIQSPEIWAKEEINKEGKKVPIVHRLFLITSPEYFIRKYNDSLKHPKDFKIPIREVSLKKSLEFLGVTHKKKLPGSASTKDKALDLLNEFLIKEKVLLDDKSESGKKNSTNIDSSINKHQDGLSKIKFLLKDFFQKINTRKYFDAWLLLSPHYQLNGQWNGDYFNFIKCFTTIEFISDVKCFDFSFLKNNIDCGLFYREKRIMFPGHVAELDDLTVIQKTSPYYIKEERDFIEVLDDSEEEIDFSTYDEELSYKQKLKVKTDELRKIMHQLEQKIKYQNVNILTPTYEEQVKYIYFNFRDNKNTVELMFPNCYEYMSSVECRCSFIYFEQRWLIRNLSGLMPLYTL